MNGSWSRKGCSLMEKDHNKIICSCNHLTNFAVMMQVGKNAKVSLKQIATQHNNIISLLLRLLCRCGGVVVSSSDIRSKLG